METFNIQFFNQRLTQSYNIKCITIKPIEAETLKFAIIQAKEEFPLNGEKTWVDEPDTICLVKDEPYGETLYVSDMDGNKLTAQQMNNIINSVQLIK